MPAADHWFIFQKDRLYLVNKHVPILPTNEEIGPLQPHLLNIFAVGQYNQQFCYCAEVENEIVLPPQYLAMPLKKAFEVLGVSWYVAAARAFAILNWNKNHRYCGSCGSSTILATNTFERTCQVCQLISYPRISPCMIVLVSKGNELLMARSHHFPPGAFALIAGFVEMGESVEDAVHREVKEEVGIEIKNLRYFGSQAWPFPDSLMIGFLADYCRGEICIDHNEIEIAGWYRYDNLPGRPSSNISIAGQMIDFFVEEKRKHYGQQ